MEAFNALVQSPLLQPLIAAVVGLALLFFFWWRAGSIRSVLDRIWHLVAGKGEVNDPLLKELLVNSRDLERFQFTYRIRVDSLADVHILHAWSNRHNVDVATLAKASEWVDLKNEELIKQPPRRHVEWKTAVAVVAMVLAYVAGVFLLPAGALYKTKATEVWFRMHETSMHSMFGQWSVSASDCEGERPSLVQKTGFSPQELEALCKTLIEGEAKEDVEMVVGAQRIYFLLVLLLMGPVFISSILAAKSAMLATRLRAQTIPLAAKSPDQGAKSKESC